MPNEPDFDLHLTTEQIRHAAETGDPIEPVDMVLAQALGMISSGYKEASTILIIVRK